MPERKMHRANITIETSNDTFHTNGPESEPRYELASTLERLVRKLRKDAQNGEPIGVIPLVDANGAMVGKMTPGFSEDK